MSKKVSRTRFILGTLAAAFLAAEPLMMLWQPLLPPGSYAAIATVCACIRAGLAYYMTTDVVEDTPSVEVPQEGEDDATA